MEFAQPPTAAAITAELTATDATFWWGLKLYAIGTSLDDPTLSAWLDLSAVVMWGRCAALPLAGGAGGEVGEAGGGLLPPKANSDWPARSTCSAWCPTTRPHRRNARTPTPRPATSS